jgi:hypothetical protein
VNARRPESTDERRPRIRRDETLSRERLVSPPPGIRRVAVVDDEPDSAAGMVVAIEDAGLEPLVVTKKMENVDELRPLVEGSADAVLCDNRLDFSGYAPFPGAQAVAVLTTARIPAILVTMFLDSDSLSTIRRFRYRIPVVLPRHDLAKSLNSALATCLSELEGRYAPERRPRRVILRIEDVQRQGTDEWLDVVIPAWRAEHAVRLPADMVPQNLQSDLSRGGRLFAKVNIGAKAQEDLFFVDFEQAPPPRSDESLA